MCIYENNYYWNYKLANKTYIAGQKADRYPIEDVESVVLKRTKRKIDVCRLRRIWEVIVKFEEDANVWSVKIIFDKR